MPNTNRTNSRQLQGDSSDRDQKYRNDRRQNNDFDDATNKKLREIESSGEPLSIAETISREVGGGIKASAPKPTEARTENDVTELQRMSVQELIILATAEGLEITDCLLYTSDAADE